MRQELTTSLTRQLSAVTSRRVSLTLGLWGEPGIGKTYTVRAIFEHLPCAHLSLHATANAAQIATSLPRARTLPAWAHAQLERLQGGEPLEDRAVVQTLASTLHALAPFVLHLEDLHEANAERIELIQALARAILRTRGVGLLVTSRAELPEPFRNQHLEGLLLSETAALLGRELKAEPPIDGLEWVSRRTRGNPLFTLEFARYLRRQGFLWSDGERWHWRKPPEDFVPVSIGALLAELVSSIAVTPEAQAILEARAILSGELRATRSSTLWAQLAGVDELKLEAIRASFERAGLMRGDEFAHPLFAEVITGELEADAKRLLARCALEALREIDPEGAAGLIPLAGLRDEEALGLLKHAAAQARGRGEEIRAARLLGSAARYAIGEERISLALEAEKGLLLTGDYRLREQLARLALDTQPNNREARSALVRVYALTGRVKDMTTLIAELPETQQLETCWIEERLRALSNAGRFAETVAVWEEHQASLTRANRSSSRYAILAYCNIGELQRAEEIIDELLSQNDLSPMVRIAVVNQLALLRSDQGRLEEAELLHDESIALVRQNGNLHNLGTGYYNRALNRARLGQFIAARDDTKEAIGLFEQAGNISAAAYSSIFYGHLLLHQGAFEQAERVLLEAHESYWRWNTGPRRIACEIEIAFLYLQWHSPHSDALSSRFARDALSHARALSDQSMIHLAMATAARVAVLRGESGKAIELATQALRSIEADVLVEDEDGYTCLVALAQALELNGRGDEALKCWYQASRIAEVLHSSLELHEAQLEIARLQCDWESVRTLRTWFVERGLGLGVRRADACLETPPLEMQIILTARINVLGSVALARDAQPVPTRAKKRLEILAYLLETRIAGRSEASALELVDTFYAGTPEPEARNTLKQQIYLIRSSFGAESVVSTATGYALGAVSSDAEDFLRGENSNLWRGAYLSGLSDGFHAGVREALTLALHSSIENQLEANPSEAARLGLILIEMEPYDAEALRLAVSALERAGETRAARRAFSEGRVRLSEIGEVLPELPSEFLTARATA